jgi:hypothetical protein
VYVYRERETERRRDRETERQAHGIIRVAPQSARMPRRRLRRRGCDPGIRARGHVLPCYVSYCGDGMQSRSGEAGDGGRCSAHDEEAALFFSGGPPSSSSSLTTTRRRGPTMGHHRRRSPSQGAPRELITLRCAIQASPASGSSMAHMCSLVACKSRRNGHVITI